MKKFNSSRNIIIALTIVILMVLLISFSAMQRDNKKQSLPGQSEVNGIIATIDNVIKAPIVGVENMAKSINNLFNTYSENDNLKKKVDKVEALKNDITNLKDENEKLKQQLELNENLLNYDVINASVINRSPDSWQDTLIIDKGTADGIEVNMAVMGDKGLIGRVIIAEKHSSKVELLTTVNQTTNHFPVMLENKKGEMAYGLMEAYNNKTHTLVVSQLTSAEDIEVGTTVSTSGLGNNSPKGLIIGEVKEVKKSKTGLTDEVSITPLANMYDVGVVTVVKRLAGSN